MHVLGLRTPTRSPSTLASQPMKDAVRSCTLQWMEQADSAMNSGGYIDHVEKEQVGINAPRANATYIPNIVSLCNADVPICLDVPPCKHHTHPYPKQVGETK